MQYCKQKYDNWLLNSGNECFCKSERGTYVVRQAWHWWRWRPHHRPLSTRCMSVGDRRRQRSGGSRVAPARRCTAAVSCRADRQTSPPASPAAPRSRYVCLCERRHGAVTPARRRHNARCPVDRRCRRCFVAEPLRHGRRQSSNRKYSRRMISSELIASTPCGASSCYCSSAEYCRRDLLTQATPQTNQSTLTTAVTMSYTGNNVLVRAVQVKLAAVWK